MYLRLLAVLNKGENVVDILQREKCQCVSGLQTIYFVFRLDICINDRKLSAVKKKIHPSSTPCCYQIHTAALYIYVIVCNVLSS